MKYLKKIKEGEVITYYPEDATSLTDFEIEPTVGYILEVEKEVTFQVRKGSRIDEARYKIRKNQYSTIGIPFDKKMRYSDLKPIINQEFMIIYYSYKNARFESYHTEFIMDGTEADRLIDPHEGIILLPLENDLDITLKR